MDGIRNKRSGYPIYTVSQLSWGGSLAICLSNLNRSAKFFSPLG